MLYNTQVIRYNTKHIIYDIEHLIIIFNIDSLALHVVEAARSAARDH